MRERAARSSAPSCPTARRSSTSRTTAGTCAADGERLRPLIAEAHALGVRVSLFMDADPDADGRGAARSAPTASSSTPSRYAQALRHAAAGRACSPRFAAAAEAAQAAGLGVNAGHDLNRDNLAAFLRAVPGVLEVSIGHALDRRRARARAAPRRCATTCAASTGRSAARRDDLRHRHRHLRRPPHPRRRWSGTASASPSKVLGAARDRGLPGAPRALGASAACATWRRASRPRRPSRKAIGLGMRMPMTWRACEIVKRAERQARDRAARRAGRLVRRRAACAPM